MNVILTSHDLSRTGIRAAKEKGKRKVGNFGVVVVFTPDLPMLLTPTWLHKKNILKFN